MSDPFTDKILARLYRDDGALSRNRNYEAFRDARVQRAARISRQLRSLATDLLTHGSPSNVEFETGVTAPADLHDGQDADDALSLGPVRASVRVTIDALECRRTAFLTRFELELLAEDPRIASLLGHQIDG